MELRTRYGKLTGCIQIEYDVNGGVKGCCFEEENKLFLDCGTLIPQYGEETVRKKYIQAVSFYESGALRRVALELQTEIETPIGPFPAELVTFYESGAVRRIFPLNGKLSGYWQEPDEAALAIPFSFEFDFGSFQAKIVSIHFFESGSIQSITLFPGEEIALQTPAGQIPVRRGFSLYEDGTLESVEPAQPTPIETKIGRIEAYDVSAVGIEADSNSLIFSERGEILAVKTSSQNILVQSSGQPLELIAPVEKPSPLDDDKTVTVPVAIRFAENTAVLRDEKDHVYALDASRFTILKSRGNTCSSCSDCSLCDHCGSSKPIL